MKVVVLLFAAAMAASAAGVDGHWTAQTTVNAKKKAAAADAAKPAKTEFSLDLETKDGALTGMVSIATKKKPKVERIFDGKIDGSKVTFTTVQATKKQETRITWEATVDGDRITGTRTREGAKHGEAFTANRGGKV